MDLGKLKVVFDGDTTKLESAQRRVKTTLSGINRAMLSAGKAALKYGSILAGIGAGGLLGSITLVVRSQSQMIDSLAKTADALGVSTEKLQAFQHAGELNGITAEEVNKALARMERRIGEVARIGGTAVFAFKDIGINIDEIVKKNPAEQFEILAASISKLENQSVKASIANDLFGRSGLKALKLMEQLKDEGIKPTVEELDALGFSVSRIDAAKVEAANDSMLRFRKTTQGVFNAITIYLAPILEGISNDFINMMKESGGAEQAIKDFADGAVNALGLVGDAVWLVYKAIQVLGKGLDWITSKVSDWVKTNVKVTESGQKFLDKLKEQTNDLFPELPSSRLKKKFDQYQSEALKRAAELEKTLQGKSLTGDFSSSFFDQQKQNQLSRGGGKSENDFERFRESLLTEEQLEIESYQKRLEQLQQFFENKKLTEDEAMLARETIERQHQDALTAIQSGALQERMSLISSTMQTQVSNIADSLKFITGVAGKEGKKQFEIAKVASIATALVKGGEAVISSYAAGAKIGGPVLGAAFAATAAGAVGAQIQSIRSQQYGGAGGSAATGGGGNSAAGAQQQAQAQGPQRAVRIQGINPNDIFSGEQVKSLIEKINDEVNDGATLISTGFSQ